MTNNGGEAAGLYIHAPFCRGKCPYCDFYSEAPTEASMDAWLGAIGREADLYRDRFPAFDSLHLGGGTPSLLSARTLSALLDVLRRTFRFLPGSEFAIEVNPDDVTHEKAALFRELGFNRVSVGAQSFDDAELRALKRRHTAAQTLKALDVLRSAGFDNIGIDLMYGLGGQTLADWEQTLGRALAFGPEHLSCYQLTIEKGTPYGKMLAKGRLTELDDETGREFFLFTSRLLTERGFVHYEISNFAIDDAHRSRHNGKYWRGAPYLGLGPSAHSFHGGERWWSHRSLKKHLRALGSGGPPAEGRETLTPDQIQLEALYLGFRTKEGVSLEVIHDFPAWEAVLSELRDSGLARVVNGRILPTPEGFLVADSLPLLFMK